jgi:hypothetical protein
MDDTETIQSIPQTGIFPLSTFSLVFGNNYVHHPDDGDGTHLWNVGLL